MQPRDKFFTALLGIRSAASGEQAGSGSVEVIAAGKRLDPAGMETVRASLMSCAERGSWHYVLDLTKVKLIDSAGLGMLVNALRTIRDLGGSVGLVTDSPPLQRLLELCARNRNCNIYSCTGDAKKALMSATQPKTAA